MSKTHKTKPFWVKMMQGHLATSEFHDHRDGPCDLPPQVELDEWMRTGRCRHEFRYTGIRTCGPSCCGDPSDSPSRRQRSAGKRAVSSWQEEYDSDIAPEYFWEYQDWSGPFYPR